MPNTTDRLYERVLVLRCQSGDEVAFTELVERYHPRLRYYLRKMLRDLQGAEDALQDVWVAAFRSVSRLADVGAFRAWLYRIARDRALRELRKCRPSYQPLEADLIEERAEEAHFTAEDVERIHADLIEERAEEAHFTAEDVERIHAALDELSAEHREVLVFRYVEGMTYEELARVVGCQVGTVRSRLHYAKRALRDVLERMKFHD